MILVSYLLSKFQFYGKLKLIGPTSVVAVRVKGDNPGQVLGITAHTRASIIVIYY